MSEDARWLDGNAMGGLLQELFGAEMTAAPHTCQSCGAERPVAAHRVYLGAGTVLRCPVCNQIAALQPSKSVFGPGTFLYLSVAGIQQALQGQIGGAGRAAQLAGRKAARPAARSPCPPRAMPRLL